MTSLIHNTEADDRPAFPVWTAEENARFAVGRARQVEAANARRAAKQGRSMSCGPEFDGPIAGKTVKAPASSYQTAVKILEAAVFAAVNTPAQVILATATASVTFTPTGDKVKVVSRGVENWGTRILSVAEARLHYRKLRQAGFLVW